MVTVRGRKKSLAPRMVPPRVIRSRTESESEEELLEEADSNVSTDVSEATFIHVHGSTAETRDGGVPHADAVAVAEKVVAKEVRDAKVATPTTMVEGAAAKSTSSKAVEKAVAVELDTTRESNDSGHSDMMDTTAQSADEIMPGYHAAVSMMEETIRTTFPITARPPCTVNAEMVKDRVTRTKKTLDLDLTAEKLVLHANTMAKTMQTYVENVKACFNHISVVAGAAQRDEEKVMLRCLNKTYGLPEGQMDTVDKMYPTIPTAHIATCTKSVKYFSEQPLDKQANLVALCYIMVKGHQQQVQRGYLTVVNDGDCHFGDQTFRGLNSYRTMGKKLDLSDFGHFYRADQYFVNGEADLAQVGTDVYSLCGMASTNLALNVRIPTFTKRLMEGSTRVTRESVRRSLVQQMEKHSDDPSVFLDELSHMIHDMHDYQQLCKKVSREAIDILTFVGRLVRNVTDSEMSKRRAQYAQKELSKELQTMFTSDCRLKSLFSRTNRCLKDFFNSMLAPVDGLKVNQSPSIKLDIPAACLSISPEFTGSWGGQGGVHSDLFMSFRDNIKDKFGPGIASAYEPREDTLRVSLGTEFTYAFSPATFKRPRPPSNTRLTPDGKTNRLTRSGSDRSLYNSSDEQSDTIDLTGVRRLNRSERSHGYNLSPAENLKAWEQSYGL